MAHNLGQFPARILTDRALSNDQLTSIADLGDTELFFWRAEISSDRLDSYFTHMAESTLRNFAKDAANGVTFLDSHNSRQLGYGQSLTGTFEVEGEISRVISDFYTVPGIRFGAGLTYESTDDFIKAVKTRLVRDVSVGFYGGDMICDICGNSFYDWRDCPHWPGVEYPVGEQGQETITATFEVTDAHLAEVSAVFDGATPLAMIHKARKQAEAGELDGRVAKILEVKYRIKPLESYKNWPGADINERSQKSMSDKNTEQAELDQIRQVGEILSRITFIPVPYTLAEGTQALVDEIERLQPLADDGQQYRADLIEEALAEGVRASGDKFPAETYRGMLQKATIEHIKQIRDDFAAQARRRFPPGGGRQTVDDNEPDTVEIQSTPDAAYVA